MVIGLNKNTDLKHRSIEETQDTVARTVFLSFPDFSLLFLFFASVMSLFQDTSFLFFQRRIRMHGSSDGSEAIAFLLLLVKKNHKTNTVT